MAAILVRIKRLSGAFRTGISRRIYCEALVLAAYDTGLRRSDLWRIRLCQIRPDGSVILRQSKTGNPHNPRLRGQALALIRQLGRDPPLACPYKSASRWYRWWHKNVVVPAGVRPGCLQQIRRTAATHLAIEHPEAVQRFLGHTDPEMQRHYVDESIARPQQFLPPEL